MREETTDEEEEPAECVYIDSLSYQDFLLLGRMFSLLFILSSCSVTLFQRATEVRSFCAYPCD